MLEVGKGMPTDAALSNENDAGGAALIAGNDIRSMTAAAQATPT